MRTLRIGGAATAAALLCFGQSVAAQATFQGLGDLPGGMFYSLAYAVSADGSVVVGNTVGPNDAIHAFRWTVQDGMQSLGHLPGPATHSDANGISADGTVIVGASDFGTAADGRMAYRWTAATGMTPLTLLPPGDDTGNGIVDIDDLLAVINAWGACP